MILIRLLTKAVLLLYCRPTVQTVQFVECIEWRSHAPSAIAHGTYEIEKYEWVSMERKQLFSGPSLYMPWITHMLFVDLNDNFSCKEN